MILVKGKNLQQVRFSYNRDLNLYLVRTCEYLDETEERSDSEQFILPRDTSDDFCMQYCNMRKVREHNKRTGEEKIIWKKTGQCDYRMADVHSFICLDIPFLDVGVLRHKIEEEIFTYNPYKRLIVSHESSPRTAANSTEGEDEDFIDTGKEWF
jgi:hypothetical protein